MKLELEMQELEQVWYGLDGSAKLLDELAKVLNKHQKAEKTWEGSGRDAYDTLEDQLKPLCGVLRRPPQRLCQRNGALAEPVLWAGNAAGPAEQGA